MKNLKDKITNIAGFLMVIFGALTGAGVAELLPQWLLVTSVIGTAICGGIIGWYNGKTANGKKKPDHLIDMQSKVIWQGERKSAGIPDTTKEGKEQDSDPPTTPPDVT